MRLLSRANLFKLHVLPFIADSSFRGIEGLDLNVRAWSLIQAPLFRILTSELLMVIAQYPSPRYNLARTGVFVRSDNKALKSGESQAGSTKLDSAGLSNEREKRVSVLTYFRARAESERRSLSLIVGLD